MYLKKRIETIFHSVIRKTGYDIVKCKYSRAELEIEQLLSLMQIGCVLDIGANEGQFAKHLRIGGYKKKIISFEPIKEPFIKLAKLSVKDQLWEIHNMALGDHDGQAEINISANSVSSSLLGMQNSHLEAAP